MVFLVPACQPGDALPAGDAPLSKGAPESGELAPQATKGLSLSRLPAQPCQPGNLLRRVAFSAMRKPPKNRQRRGLPPPCGIHPAGTRLSLRQGDLRPLARWGHIDGMAILWVVPAPLSACTSTPGALPWCAAVPSGRWPGSRRRERRCTKVGPDVKIARP